MTGDRTRRNWLGRLARHPLVLPAIIIWSFWFISTRLGSIRSEWAQLHLTILVIGSAIVVCVWLVVGGQLERVSKVGERFDEVTRDHRPRIRRLEEFRERQIRYNRNERARVKALADEVEALRPILQAIRTRSSSWADPVKK